MLIKDFINYLLKPEFIHAKEPNGRLQSAWAAFRIWSLTFLISLFGVPISLLISNLFGVSFADHAGYQYAADRTMLQVIWGAILFFPVWEELVFRIGLRFSRINLSVGLAFAAIYFARLVMIVLEIPRPSWLFSPDTIVGIMSILVPALSITIFIWRLLSFIGDERLASFYQRRFDVVFYLPLLTFALLHALNYEKELWILAPLITIPQLFLAAGFGYIRMKYGLGWSVSMHILNNAFSFLPALILEELSSAILNRFVQGDLTAKSELSGSDAVLYFAFTVVWSIVLMVIFLSLVSLIWDWARARSERKRYAFISSTLNCLLPGLGQLYNHQEQKGKTLVGSFLILSLTVSAVFSVPANYSSMGRILVLGTVTFALYLIMYLYAITDSWIVGLRLDKAAMERKNRGDYITAVPRETVNVSSQIKFILDPAQLTGAVIGLLMGWGIALTIISNGLLYKPFAIAAGVIGGMLIGWLIWFALVRRPIR
ncbi:MAG: CPBP family intramembrane metalloprotease [Anaerolineales bacterium]|nr:CPBP family intramembrane metalloprotease [Anaerolineales bacterium]